MDFNSIDIFKNEGFVGFKKISELFEDSTHIPKIRGVYFILNFERKSKFLNIGTGGFFKGKNPNVSLNELKNNWVDNALVVYSVRQVMQEVKLHYIHD